MVRGKVIEWRLIKVEAAGDAASLAPERLAAAQGKAAAAVMSAHAWGARGEDLAHRFLQKLGYMVVARNWRAEDGSGELDLVAWDGASLVVVEVKTRASTEFGLPEEAVDAAKASPPDPNGRPVCSRSGDSSRLASFRYCQCAAR